MSSNLNIYALNTIFAGTESLNTIKKSIHIKGIIGLKKNLEDKNIISGYNDMNEYCESNNIKFIGVDSYSLNNEKDKEKLLNLNIDILLVLGWQRLIPDWLINSVKVACIGAHGSPWGIEGGRGRSPINWALIANKDKFLIDVFKINNGIDSGEIYDEQEFIINQFDDVNSIYYKVSWNISQMIIKNLNNGNILHNIYCEQSKSLVRYLPKRIPEDGEIDWNRTSIEIYNFVRALTKPYPGAFSYLNNKPVYIWHAIPFDNLEGFDEYASGEIIKYYSTQNEYLVKCNEGAILVKEYSSELTFNSNMENKVFQSANFRNQMKEILIRHYSKNSINICNEEIEQL